MYNPYLKPGLKLSFIVLILFCSPLSWADRVPLVAAAASVKFALQDIAEAFHRDTGKEIRISYASSGNLTRQIQQGAPFELFLSANHAYVEQLYQQQLTRDHGVIYALGRLVLLTPNESSLALDGQLNGLAQAIQQGRLQRFAIANPKHAPYGRAAREVLRQQGLWKLLKPHLVLGENVAQAAQFVTSGAAQAGLSAYSLALAPALKNTCRIQLIPASRHQPLQQTLVLLHNAGDSARLFFIYLQQDKARAILAHYGYMRP